MLITFGMDLDGSPWSQESASLGSVQLGPAGLLSLLETRLGLGGPPIHPARRIDQYLVRLEASDGPGEWFHGSLKADPWSTARQLLAWRDELVEAGWDGTAGSEASPRLAGLARAEERVGLPLAPGRADRLQEVLEHLGRGRTPGIGKIRLLDPVSLLPPTWGKLLRQLRGLGAEIETAPPPDPGTGPSTHLARIRSRLGSIDDSQFVPSPDDESVLLLSADTEWDAAETAALWLESEFERWEGAEADDGRPADVAIICGRDTRLLDQALSRRGLPTLERSNPSPWRNTLQLLPLVLANVWHPVDVSLLAELLSHENTPVPRRAARKLMRALQNEPGVGGPDWTEALEKVEEMESTRLAEKGVDHPDREATRFRSELHRRLAVERFPPSEGVSADVVVDRCEWVMARLGFRTNSDPLAAAALAHATELRALARRREAEGRALPRVTLERILDSLLGPGEKAPDQSPRAAPWTVVRSPGQITRPVDTILWWGFTHEVTAPATWWTESELEALEKAGVELQRPAIRRELEACNGQRPLECAGSRLLLLHPERIQGEVQEPHPLWDEIRSAAGIRPGNPEADGIEAALVRPCRELARNGHWGLAGQTRLVETAPSIPLTGPTTRIQLNAVFPGIGDSTSFSRMSSLIGCPFRLAMDRAGLRGATIQEIPAGSQVEGLLCHRIVELLLDDPQRLWTAAEAEVRAGQLYDELVGVMAAEMLLPGRELENQRLRHGIVDAAGTLVEALNRHGLTVEAAEESLERAVDPEEPGEAPAGCTTVTGRADLVLQDADGGRYVLDLKWSRSSRYKRDEVESGEALQLATYAWLLGTEEPEKEVQSGYFMLAQGELLAPEPGFGDDALPSPRTLAETWRRGVRTWNARWHALTEKRVLDATGVQERRERTEQGMTRYRHQKERREAAEAAGLLYIKPPCRWCDFGSLCGLKGMDS